MGVGGTEGLGADSVGRFVDDLAELRRREGDAGYKALARNMKLAHGTVHNALTQRDRLPSEYVVSRMIGYWRPQEVNDWLVRRNRLASGQSTRFADKADVVPQVVAGDKERDESTKEVGRRRRTFLSLALLFGGVAVGLIAGTPFPAGGVDVVEYCRTNVAPTTVRPEFEGDGTWSGWRCIAEDGRASAVDMDQACEQQRPPPVPWGRSFAGHVNKGAASWRCYTSLLYPVFNDH